MRRDETKHAQFRAPTYALPIGSNMYLKVAAIRSAVHRVSPNGHRVKLPTRKAVLCECWERQQHRTCRTSVLL